MKRRVVSSEKSGAISAARREAFVILQKVAQGEAHSDDLLRGKRVSALSLQDRHLCTTLVLGVLRWQIYLDARIRPLLARPGARLEDEVAIALRIGAFQLWFLDRIPAHAAIGESVALAKAAGHRFASGMVNAVLRKAALLGREESPDPCAAYPAWMVGRWRRLYGEATSEICRQGQAAPEVALRSSADDAELAAEGVAVAAGVLVKAARRVISGDITETQAFASGRVRIQEEGSQLIAELSAGQSFSPRKILDCCAAPGGKTMVLADVNPKAHVTACEVSQPRFEALRKRIEAHAGQGDSRAIDVVLGDITQLAWSDRYDFVLADVPCSGTGTLGRNPEIRHRMKLEDLARHHERQCAILRAALEAAARTRARVVYSTCSLESEENGAVVAEILQEAPGWRRVPMMDILTQLAEAGRITEEGAALLRPCVSDEGSLLLLPGALGEQHRTDGFFMATLERIPA